VLHLVRVLLHNHAVLLVLLHNRAVILAIVAIAAMITAVAVKNAVGGSFGKTKIAATNVTNVMIVAIAVTSNAAFFIV